MFDSVLSMFVKQLGAATFSVEGSALVVKFANRSAVRLNLAPHEVQSIGNGATALLEALSAISAAAASQPAANGAAKSAAAAPAPKAAPAKPKATKK